MSLGINVPNDLPSFTQRLVLDGSEYQFDWDWNERESRWYVEISDAEGSPIVRRLKVVTNWPLLRGEADSRIPPGLLMVIDTSGAAADPLYGEWGTRWLLTYTEAADL